jgi:hypothetical protein
MATESHERAMERILPQARTDNVELAQQTASLRQVAETHTCHRHGHMSSSRGHGSQERRQHSRTADLRTRLYVQRAQSLAVLCNTHQNDVRETKPQTATASKDA